MESKYIIKPDDPVLEISALKDSSLDIMELFYDTIQGEGVSMGAPSVFLRMNGCTLDCAYCDTDWRKGHRYSFAYLFEKLEEFNIIEKFKKGHRLIITGGSPLKQQYRIALFLVEFHNRYNFTPVIEVENECVLMPIDDMLRFIDVWNNSPKLSSSGMNRLVRYKPMILKRFSILPNSWFKFVVSCEEDWQEIQMDYLDPGLIRHYQIILMPLGATIEELSKNRPIVLKMAIQHGVRYSTREQIVVNEL